MNQSFTSQTADRILLPHWMALNTIVLLFLAIITPPLMALTSWWYCVTTRNHVEIWEMNKRVFMAELYTNVRTIHQAENWLLERGYKVRDIRTYNNAFDLTKKYRFEKQDEPEFVEKRFFVKGTPGSEDESVVFLRYHYGNNWPTSIPFNTPYDDGWIDWDRFEYLDLPSDERRTAFPMVLASTDRAPPSVGDWLYGSYKTIQPLPLDYTWPTD